MKSYLTPEHVIIWMNSKLDCENSSCLNKQAEAIYHFSIEAAEKLHKQERLIS